MPPATLQPGLYTALWHGLQLRPMDERVEVTRTEPPIPDAWVRAKVDYDGQED